VKTLLCRALLMMMCVTLCASLLTPAYALSVENSYNKARKAYFELLDSPRKQKYRDQWLKVRKLFLQVHDLDSEHQRSADALYMAGKISQGLYDVSYVKDDLRAAIAYFDQLALEHPGSSLVDDGLLIAAQILEEKFGDQKRAIEHYRRLVSIYHDGDMFAAARARLKELAPEALQVASPPPPARVPAKAEGAIIGVRYHTYPDFTRVVLDLEGNASATPGFVKGDDPRIFIDLAPGDIGVLKQAIDLGDGRVRQVRGGQYRNDVARVVLDLDAANPYQVFTLNDPFRVIIDISGPLSNSGPVVATSAPQKLNADSGAHPGATVTAQLAAAAMPKSAAGASPSSASKAAAASAATVKLDEQQLAEVLDSRPKEEQPHVKLPENKVGRGVRIVLDPGHGGKDPGAIGPRGLMEKDVTLALAKALSAQLKKRFPCEVILTRDSDVYIPLDERTLIANRLDADLFVSLHANANRSRKPYGAETYYLNFSKNDDVIEVVARENGTSLQKVGDLDMILLDLMANSKINESSRLAAEIQEALIDGLSRKYSNIKDLGVRQGPFHVLWNATMPSVLVEVAFISNRREEKRLADQRFQTRSAEAIATGVGHYLEAYNLASN